MARALFYTYIFTILYISLPLILSQPELESSDGIQWRPELDPNEKYQNSTWITYMREIEGQNDDQPIKVTLKNFSGGGIDFAWKSNKVGLFGGFELFIKDMSQKTYKNFNYGWDSVTGYKIDRSDDIWWNLSFPKGGKVWIAFPQPINNSISEPRDKVPIDANHTLNRTSEEQPVQLMPVSIDQNLRSPYSIGYIPSNRQISSFHFRDPRYRFCWIKPIDADKQSAKIIEYNYSYVKVNNTNYDESNFIYRSINQALQYVKIYGIIEIDEGNYTEDIEINKPIHLKGADRNKTSINGSQTAIRILSDNTSIENLKILGGKKGVCINSAKNCTLSQLTINFSETGILMKNADNCSIIDNLIYSQGYGIAMEDDSNFSVINKNYIINEQFGIAVNSSNNNIFSENNFSHNAIPFVCINEYYNDYPENLHDCRYRDRVRNMIVIKKLFEWQRC